MNNFPLFSTKKQKFSFFGYLLLNQLKKERTFLGLIGLNRDRKVFPTFCSATWKPFRIWRCSLVGKHEFFLIRKWENWWNFTIYSWFTVQSTAKKSLKIIQKTLRREDRKWKWSIVTKNRRIFLLNIHEAILYRAGFCANQHVRQSTTAQKHFETTTHIQKFKNWILQKSSLNSPRSIHATASSTQNFSQSLRDLIEQIIETDFKKFYNTEMKKQSEVDGDLCRLVNFCNNLSFIHEEDIFNTLIDTD